MTTWASLTADQQALVESLANSVRGAFTTAASLTKQGQVIAAAYNGGISTILNSLDAGETIPNTSGLSGAQGLAPADLINSVGYLIDLSNPANNTQGGGYNTPFHQALRVKLTGINAAVTA
jgi:hypothetical protein